MRHKVASISILLASIALGLGSVQAKTGQTLNISQSHGGSGKQALSVRDDLEGNVVTLAQGYDIDALAQKTHLADGATVDRIYSKK